MGFSRLLLQVSRQHLQLRNVKNLYPCSYHTSLMFASNKGITNESVASYAFNCQEFNSQHRSSLMMSSRALYSSDASSIEVSPKEAELELYAKTPKELHDKIIKSITDQKTAPRNSWLWALIVNCDNREDIKLLFNVLENLRKFRLSSLRISKNFNENICRYVSHVCVSRGATDFAKKTLWKHNVYGLTPSVASAHNILLYAKKHNDVKLMVDVMKLLKANDLPLQPGTADIIFSICYNTNSWDLMCKYAKRFVKAGVKLRRTSFDTWMTFAAKLGDVDSLWKVEKLRSEVMKTHTIGSCFSCAKGLLLERKPEESAAIIQVITQTFPEAKKSEIMLEIERLVNKWPLEVLKNRKDEDKMALAAGLLEDIPAMISSLRGLGVKTDVKLEDSTKRAF
ncbi:uncharacterized protein [Rutidosis leptorrhynchoides]|uniref:uncharacterized protein n=1 Tax=Rutidosis leptorrhynchoides TaxID=125765 RepID=UPI003A99EC28